MHPGEYKGKNADSKAKRILILGESHHWSAEDWKILPNETEEQAEERRRKKAKNYTTEKIVENYLENYKTHDNRASAYRFFDKIVLSFGIDPEQHREEFWSNVYFGNYVEQLCGINNSLAKQFVKSNRWQYNNHLFEFINQNQIDIVLVFGRLSFDNMPSLSRREEKLDDLNENTLYVGNKRDWISHCKYLPNIEHYFTTVKLNKQVEVFNFRHPSAPCGFFVENYRPYIEKIFV